MLLLGSKLSLDAAAKLKSYLEEKVPSHKQKVVVKNYEHKTEEVLDFSFDEVNHLTFKNCKIDPAYIKTHADTIVHFK